MALGVSLPVGRWLQMTLLILIGLSPFAALGVLIGHLLTADSIGPAIGGITAFFAFLGGSWFPLTSGVIRDIGSELPSYWVVQASRAALGAPHPWGSHGWAAIAIWSVLLIALASRASQRDTNRL